MEDLKKNWPVILIAICAVLVSGIAAISYNTNETIQKDMWGIPLWLTPIGYFAVAWLLTSTEKINKPATAAVAVAAYALSAFILFAAPALSLQWHLPIGIWAAIITLFDL